MVFWGALDEKKKNIFHKTEHTFFSLCCFTHTYMLQLNELMTSPLSIFSLGRNARYFTKTFWKVWHYYPTRLRQILAVQTDTIPAERPQGTKSRDWSNVAEESCKLSCPVPKQTGKRCQGEFPISSLVLSGYSGIVLQSEMSTRISPKLCLVK